MRIVAFAYSCKPGEGSEAGAGWQWARMLARLAETWVITTPEVQNQIEAELTLLPERDRLHFVYVDLPRLISWDPRRRGIRVHYLLWQVAALRAARRLRRGRRFDLVWHLTFANAWLGTLAPLAGSPFIYGPVGGGPGHAPWRLFPALGLRGAAFELLREVVRGVARYANPLARLAWSRASLILVQNSETREWLPRRRRSHALVFPHVVLDALPNGAERTRQEPPTALYVGRLLPWKGVALALRALRDLPGWRLVLCGEGADERRLRRLARRLGVTERVEFRGRRPREEVMRTLRGEADLMLFPSLHDDAGWAVVEAVAAGLPVVCLDVGGPPLLAGRSGRAVPARGGVRRVVAGLAAACDSALAHDQDEFELARATAGNLVLDARAAELEALLEEHLGRPLPGAHPLEVAR